MNDDIYKELEENKLTIRQVDKLLFDTSWLEYPDLIRKLLAYKNHIESNKN